MSESEGSSDEFSGTHDARRAGRREANLRVLNTRVAASQSELSPSASSQLTVLCECADPDCNESIVLEQATFASLRDQSTRFLVVDGHVLHEVERVVQRSEGWLVVEKHGSAAREARRILE